MESSHITQRITLSLGTQRNHGGNCIMQIVFVCISPRVVSHTPPPFTREWACHNCHGTDGLFDGNRNIRGIFPGILCPPTNDKVGDSTRREDGNKIPDARTTSECKSPDRRDERFQTNISRRSFESWIPGWRNAMEFCLCCHKRSSNSTRASVCQSFNQSFPRKP